MTHRLSRGFRGLAASALLALLPGCPGGNTNGGETKAIFDAVPRAVAVGRTKTVQVRAVGTDWTPETIGVGDVTFGDGIDVLSVAVANERNVVVQIQAHPDAVPGHRAIVVGGVTRTDLFDVVPAVTPSTTDAIPAGSFFNLTLNGVDTDWDPANTTVDLGPGVSSEGDMAGHPLRVDVVRKDRIDIFGYVDLFAPTGTNDITVSSGAFTDVLPASLSVNAVTAMPLVVGDNIGTVPAPFQPMVYSVAGNFGEDLVAGLAGSSMADPIALVFSPESGTVPAATILPSSDLDRLVFADPNQTLYVSVFDRLLGGGTGYAFTLTFGAALVSPTIVQLMDGVAATNQQFMNVGEELWYQIDGSTAWQVGTVDWTSASGGMPGTQPDGNLDLFREGHSALNENSGGENIDEQMTLAIGARATTLLRVTELTGTSTGGDSSFDIVWNETPVPGNLYETSGTFLALADPQAANETATTVSTIEVPNEPDVAGVHVFVDIAHPHQDELKIEVVPPGGNPITLHDQTGTGDGLLEGYGAAGTIDVPALGALSGNLSGTWTLIVTDNVPGDAGFLRGWALYIEPN